MVMIEKEPIIKFIEDGLNNKHYGHVGVEIITEVEFAPTIDAVPVVHSYWYEHENTIVCKACGEKWSIREDGDFVIIEAKGDLKFCPSCGAKMDGEADGNV